MVQESRVPGTQTFSHLQLLQMPFMQMAVPLQGPVVQGFVSPWVHNDEVLHSSPVIDGPP